VVCAGLCRKRIGLCGKMLLVLNGWMGLEKKGKNNRALHLTNMGLGDTQDDEGKGLCS